ncbi:MAG: PPC domain-containing protein, partial [Novosphingobium sp.]
MSFVHYHRLALLVAVAAVVPAAQAQAGTCGSGASAPAGIGAVTAVAPGAAHNYTITLNGGEGVIIDLADIATRSDADEPQSSQATPASLTVCDSRGNLVAPQPGEVFAKGGSRSATEEGERLKFVAPVSAQYVIAVGPADVPRELLVRRRSLGSGAQPVIAAALDADQKGIVTSKAQMVYSFTAPAGQWVELKATSEKDTLLRLAGPDRTGAYAQIAENDDSDGLNPVIRRKLPIAGTYFVQVDSLSDEPGEFDLSLRRIAAPKPPAPPAALRAGAPVAGRLADGDAVLLYALPVVAGHAYRLELSAPYDGVVAIGLPNPLEPEDGSDKADANFAEMKSQDSNLTGTERL